MRQRQENAHDLAITLFTRLRAYDEADQHARQLEQRRGPRWWESIERPWETLSDFGEIAEGRGDPSQALNHYSEAIATYEARRQRLSSDQSRTAFAGGVIVQALYFMATRTALKLYSL